MEKAEIIKIANELLSYVGVSAKKFSESLGKESPQWIYDIFSERKPNGFSRRTIQLITEKYPEINGEYLSSGQGSLLKNSNGPVSVGGDQNGNINSPGATSAAGLDKLIGVVGQQSVQIGELIKQNQDLINIISNLSKK